MKWFRIVSNMSQSEQSDPSHAFSLARESSGNILLLPDYQAEIVAVKGDLAELEECQRRIISLNQESLMTTVEDMAEPIQEECMQREAIKARIRKRIDFLNLDGCRTPVSQNRAVKLRHANILTSQLKESLNKYEQKLRQHEKAHEEAIERQKDIVGTRAQAGNGSVFSQALKAQPNRPGKTLQDVRWRHEDLQELCSSVEDISDCFQALDRAVERQEDAICEVEENTQQAVTELQRSQPELRKAREHIKRRNRLGRWWLIIVLFTVFVVASISIPVTVKYLRSR
jgi:t-SNARE complex subunit (syntaxin)